MTTMTTKADALDDALCDALWILGDAIKRIAAIRDAHPSHASVAMAYESAQSAVAALEYAREAGLEAAEVAP
jgi:hypothetical protein